MKCCSLSWRGKFLQSHVGAAKGFHRGFEGLGRCKGGQWTRIKAATLPIAVRREVKTLVKDWTRDQVHSRVQEVRTSGRCLILKGKAGRAHTAWTCGNKADISEKRKTRKAALLRTGMNWA